MKDEAYLDDGSPLSAFLTLSTPQLEEISFPRVLNVQIYVAYRNINILPPERGRERIFNEFYNQNFIARQMTRRQQEPEVLVSEFGG